MSVLEIRRTQLLQSPLSSQDFHISSDVLCRRERKSSRATQKVGRTISLGGSWVGTYIIQGGGDTIIRNICASRDAFADVEMGPG